MNIIEKHFNYSVSSANLLSRRWTWVRSSLTVDQSDVDKSLGVQKTLVSSTLWLLLLLLLVNLWSLRFNLTGTSQGTVDFTLLSLLVIVLLLDRDCGCY